MNDYIFLIFKGNKIRCLDIGTGANAIYPLIGFSEYGWNFVGTDVDKQAIESAEKIIIANKNKIGNSIEFRLQNEPTDIFLGIIRNGDKFECSFCNPPFHANENEARASSNRKWIGLNRKNEITKKVKKDKIMRKIIKKYFSIDLFYFILFQFVLFYFILFHFSNSSVINCSI